ncbi:MAG: FkbM family methyltransferase [Clostridia bacterium]|nr:FkbM family methyltransferase [Clostridia bacterium]
MSRSLWALLSETQKPILMYGMGDGADKALSICAHLGIRISGFIASDDFVRGQSFHDKPVLTLSQARTLHGPDFIILVTFATALPDVMDHIRTVSAEQPLLIPDIPVFGDEYFSEAVLERDRQKIGEARGLLSDDLSRRLFDSVLAYRMSGSLSDLEAHTSSKEEVYASLPVHRYRFVVDLGAYTGDSIREWLSAGFPIASVVALEPDPGSFARLCAYLDTLPSIRKEPVQAAAWSGSAELVFDANSRDNRNACLLENYHSAVRPRKTRSRIVRAVSLDTLLGESRPNFIKMDIEGSEEQALLGASHLLAIGRPDLQIALYHRPADLYTLPLLIQSLSKGGYEMYLRRFPCIPAWDLNLFCVRRQDAL